MDYLNFDLTIEKRSDQTISVHVDGPAGQRKASTQLRIETLKLQFQSTIFREMAQPNDVVQPESGMSTREFGRALFSAALPDKLGTLYHLSLQKARDQGKGLRLRLRIDDPELAMLPWEYLYDDLEEGFVSLSPKTPVVRFLEVSRPSTPLTVVPPIRVLGMIASPDDLEKLDVESEKRNITKALSDLQTRELVDLHWIEGSTWRDLQQAMQEGPWHVFHFIGHGGFDQTTGEGMLALCDENNKTFKLGAETLALFLADQEYDDLRLVVLNACRGAQASAIDLFAGTAPALVRKGIPAVVAMQNKISDAAALEFSTTFYKCFANGVPVDGALLQTRRTVFAAEHGNTEWGTMVLYMRSPDGHIFDIKSDKIDPQAAAPDLYPVGILDPNLEPDADSNTDQGQLSGISVIPAQAATPDPVSKSDPVSIPDPVFKPSQGTKSPKKNVLLTVGAIACVVLAAVVGWWLWPVSGSDQDDNTTESNGSINGGKNQTDGTESPEPLALIIEGGSHLGIVGDWNIEFGGPIEASTKKVGCAGYIADSPTAIVDYTGQAERWLRFEVRSDDDDKDASILIQLPDSTWACSSFSSEPGKEAEIELGAGEFPSPTIGTYTIWVGMPTSDDPPGTLYITEPPVPRITELVEITGGSLSNSYSTDVVDYGGSFAASELDASCGVSGFFRREPAYAVRYTGTPSDFLWFGAGTAGASLLIQLPNGDWKCADTAPDSWDAERFFRFAVDVSSPERGLYKIWTGLPERDQGSSYALNISEQPPEPEIFEVVEQMPVLLGGLEALQNSIICPGRARRSRVEGRVFVQFVVDEQGRPTDVRTVRGIGGGCDEATEAAVRAARFTPGRQNGREVKVRMSLPVTIRPN